MKSKPHVLVLENSKHVTGALKSVARSAFDLREDFEFIFVIPKSNHVRQWLAANHFREVVEMPFRELRKDLWSMLFYFPSLVLNSLSTAALIRRRNISLVHSNDLYNLVPPVLSLFGNRTPYVCHVRFLPDKFPKWLFSFWFKTHCRFAKKIIVVSQTLKDRLPAHDKVIVIHNELPIEERYPEVADNAEGRPPVFLYLANYINGKGHQYALEAFARIHRQLHGWKIRFVGSDMGLAKNQAYVNRLKDTAEARGISEKIEWHPFTDDVEKEYKQSDIVLNFSDSESFSITCLEALFYGRPLIATNSGGPAEIIDHEKTGILVPVGDVDQMANAMLRLASNSHLRQQLGANSRKPVREKFSVKNTSLLLKKVYEEAQTKR